MEKLRGQLCSFGVNVIQEDDLTIAQSLVDITKEAEGSLRLWNRPPTPATPPPRAPIDLPFASFRQEPIPLHLQSRELPEERKQKQIRQKQHKRPQNRPKPQEEQRQKRLRQQQQKRPQNRRNPHLAPKSSYPPQSSTCRHCNENFSSRNALFRHLKLCKSSRSRAPSVVSSRSSTPSVSSRVSRASSVSTTSSASSASSIASIKKIQLQIFGQLYTIRSPTIRRPQDLSFLRKNDPLYGLPQNRQLRKTTATLPTKSTATISTAVPPPPVEPNTPEAPPVESSAPGALDSTDDALVLFQ